MQLANFDIDAFLREYWQKKPLLIRNPWISWNNPIEPDDLAGLACEDDVEARLVEGHPDNWAVENGPIPESRFGELGRQNWTLLVQAVDHYVPAVAALIEPFRFIPDWRIDDIMVSYASDGGGVGPHFDQYDVFLIQGLGQRRWQIGKKCDQDTPLLPHDDLRLIDGFGPVQEWVLEPGDMLYLPPGVAHNGVAVGDDCMTYSVGCRAPSRSELIGYWADDLIADLPDDDRYADPDLQKPKNPGEIGGDAIDRLHAMVTEKLTDREAFVRWFGEYSSTPKYPDLDWRPEEPISIEQFRKMITTGTKLTRNPASRFSFIAANKKTALLFIDGQTMECSNDLAQFLCSNKSLQFDAQVLGSDVIATLLVALYNQGSIIVEETG